MLERKSTWQFYSLFAMLIDCSLFKIVIPGLCIELEINDCRSTLC